jgi:hypothetical protein
LTAFKTQTKFSPLFNASTALKETMYANILLCK